MKITVQLLRLFLVFILLMSIACQSPPPGDSSQDNPCDTSNLKKPKIGSNPISLSTGAFSSGGTFTGKSITISSPIILDQTATDLEIIVEEDLDVNADIRLPQIVIKDRPPINITLVSLNKKVTIADGVVVGGGWSAPGSTVKNRGRQGVDGGTIKIIGINIDIRGKVVGNGGGLGGYVNVGNLKKTEGFGGDGGKGGKIILCALDSIHIGKSPGKLTSASVISGYGGPGGYSTAQGSKLAKSEGGRGGPGGNVDIHGTDPTGVDVQVFIEDTIKGGIGGGGGYSSAHANSVNRKSGNAKANGGPGNKGGTVTFSQAIVMALGNVAAGDGGAGRPGAAIGGCGAQGWKYILVNGNNGGDATANGGKGGSEGTLPKIPTLLSGIVNGTPGRPGSGGQASAKAGNGGNAGKKSGSGGNSGISTATGGSNGRLAPPTGPPDIKGPYKPIGSIGGLAQRAFQNGAK